MLNKKSNPEPNASATVVADTSFFIKHAGQITISALTLLLFFLFLLIYKKGVEKGKARALSDFQKLLNQMGQENNERYSALCSEIRRQTTDLSRLGAKMAQQSEGTLREMSNTNGELVRAIKKCQLIPEGFDLVPLNEGVGFHRVANSHSSNPYVLRIERIFEHRYVAQKALGRDLEKNEIVHHIFGPRTDDNRPENLCVLDTNKHQRFHSDLQWRREKNNGKFPPIELQKRLLVHEYNGILVSDAFDITQERGPAFPPIPPLAGLGVESTEPAQE